MKGKYWLKLACAVFAAVFLVICNQNPQESQLPGISIEATASDSVLAVRETLSVSVDTVGVAGRTIRYCWIREGSWTMETSSEPLYRAVWQFPDTGIRRIIVWATDTMERESLSNRDTVAVRIVCFSPRVNIRGPAFAAIADTIVLRAQGADRDGTIERFEWLIAGRRTIVTSEDTLAVQWTKKDTGRQIIMLRAVDNDGLRSAPDSLIIRVAGSLPYFTLSGDSAVSVNDTVRIICRAADDDGTVMQYHWSIDNGKPAWIITPADTFEHLWRMPDTGIHVVRCRVIDNSGLVSRVDSMAVHVYARPPRVNLTGPRWVKVNEVALFIAVPADDDGRVVNYQWSIESSAGASAKSTSDPMLAAVWQAKDIGSRVVEVTAIDDDSLRSAAARCTVEVTDAILRMVSVADTTVSSRDTLMITRTLADTSRRAVLFYWDIGGDGWDDSTVSPQRKIFFTGVSPLTVIAGVRDTYGDFYRDTTIVTFNRPPQIDYLSLSEKDTAWMGEMSIPGALRLYCRVSDSDNDASASIVWGRANDVDTLICADTALLPVDSTGNYRWTFTVTDLHGHQVQRSGNIVVGKEHSVCFIGHSIVAGDGGDNNNGGFRAGVLTGLRDSIGAFERVRAVGPITTNCMTAFPNDDSCFAISGSRALDIQICMDHGYKDLTADIWVLMLGVNDGFKETEMKATAALINRMFTRNPLARVYVLRSPPIAGGSTVQRNYYNSNITDTIKSWAARGFGAFIVRSDSVLWHPKDTLRINDSLFLDNVHPNQKGYDRLRDEILRIMWNSLPPVLPVKRSSKPASGLQPSHHASSSESSCVNVSTNCISDITESGASTSAEKSAGASDAP